MIASLLIAVNQNLTKCLWANTGGLRCVSGGSQAIQVFEFVEAQPNRFALGHRLGLTSLAG